MSAPVSPGPPPPSGTPRVAAVVLAGGTSTRMQDGNKLLAELDGRAVIERVVATAVASRADPVVVVLGHRATEVRGRMPDGVVLVDNPRYATGLASSLVAGVRALPAAVDGCVVLLGDMPLVRPSDVDALIGSFDAGAPCVPVVDGRRGNPVVWPRAFFHHIVELDGDRGARRIFEEEDMRVVEVPLENPGLLFDIDTRADLERARARSSGRRADRASPQEDPPPCRA